MERLILEDVNGDCTLISEAVLDAEHLIHLTERNSLKDSESWLSEYLYQIALEESEEQKKYPNFSSSDLHLPLQRSNA